MADPTVIAAVRAAVAAQPENAALRLHLAQLLLDGGCAADAWAEARTALSVQPTDLEALRCAAQCAEAAGDATAAKGYRDLAAVLRGADRASEPRPLDREAPALAPPRRTSSETAGGVRLRVLEGGDSAEADTEVSSITFDDVVGMESAKERLELGFLGPLRNPELRSMYRKTLRGGLLLYGPPGCGKTYLAQACAGELQARFLSIGISDVLDMWLGESERKLHELFEQARRQTPCVLFLDEVDALGHKRTQLKHSAGRTLVNQLLQELDSVESSNEGVFVLAATNHPWDLDSALRRPGRLDRTVLVPPPDPAARRGILELNLEDRPVQGIDLDWIARRTKRFSGADLSHLIESAAELALADAVKTGTARPIEMRDLKRALSELKPSTEAWLQTARNFATYVNDGGAFDDLLAWLKAN